MCRHLTIFRRIASGSLTLLHRSSSAVLVAVVLSVAANGQTPDKVVTWVANLPSQGLVTQGKKFAARLEAKIQPDWHVYSISQPPGGPTATVITVPGSQLLRQAGTVIGPLPHSSYDPNFQMETEFYRDSAVFSVPLVVAPGAVAGSGRATIDVVFQACNDRICLPPATVHVPLSFRIVAPKAAPNHP